MMKKAKSQKNQKPAQKTKVKSRPLQKLGPVLWALDPLSILSQKADFQRGQIEALLPDHAKLKTVSVVAPEDLYLPAVEGVQWGKRFDALLQVVTNPKIETLRDEEGDVEILSATSRKKATDALINYSIKNKASLVVTQVHPLGLSTEKQRVSHFTQKLIEKSRVPVLAFRELKGLQSRKILFTTDFSKKSNNAYKRVLSFAKDFNLSVAVYHNIFDPVQIVAEITGVSMTGNKTLVDYAQHQSKALEAHRSQYEKMAQKERVEISFRVSRENNEITPLILAAAENEHADFIALGIESHPVLRAWLPSAVRELLEESKKPLLFVTLETN
jgi:nucleotide-binding universal stress UspA family protein